MLLNYNESQPHEKQMYSSAECAKLMYNVQYRCTTQGSLILCFTVVVGVGHRETGGLWPWL